MPEIAEVARVVHFLRLHLVGNKIQKVVAPEDTNVFGKVGTTGSAFSEALTGRKVVSAGSQGKYFWIELDKSPHAVMHLGMTGWVHIKGVKTAYTNYYKRMKPGEEDQWPPKHCRFQLETAGNPKVEVAFTDPRRFGRVRLVDCAGADIRSVPPLSLNGPDPVVDADIFTLEFFRDKMRKRHVPVKALLLDQATLSGVGNWVADEVLFLSRLHPEQYCDEFDDSQIKKLYDSICHVCRTAVDKLGDSDQFPEDWLFHYRWGKGTKDSVAKLPNGEKLAFITVGGRTSCYAPNLQKKTGRVAPGTKEEPVKVEDKMEDSQVMLDKPVKPSTKSKRKREDDEPTPTKPAKVKTPLSRNRKAERPLPEDETAGSRRSSARLKAR